MKKKSQVNPKRLSLRRWALLEDLRKKIKDKAEEGNWSAIPELIFQALELTVGNRDYRNDFWIDVAQLYTNSVEINEPTKPFPILTSKEKGGSLPWEYDGRSWYFWLNLFAKSYGWDAEKIGEMDIDDALGLYQETVIDDQLEKEWEWGLSEVSYVYDKNTKKSNFQKLPRPDWMLGIVGKQKPVKKVKILRSMLPQGNIVSLDQDDSSSKPTQPD